MPAKNKVLSQLLSLAISRVDTTKGNTTLNAAVAKGASTISVASITNFANGGAISIGSGNELEHNKINGAPAGNTITLQWPLQRAHASGEDAKGRSVYDHGAPDDGGVDAVIAGQVQDVQVATQRMPLTNVKGYLSLDAEWSWPYVDLNTLVTALGVLLSKISGAGTVASPKQFITDGNEFGAETDAVIIAGGLLVDGTVVYVELWGCSMDYSGVGQVQLTRGQAPKIQARAHASGGGVITTTAPGYTLDLTKRAQKTQVWRALSEVGLRVAAGAGVNTTLTAAPAAGAVAIQVASTVGGVTGDRIKIGTGSDAEYPVIDTVVDANNFTLRTKLLHAHANADAVVEYTDLKFAGVSDQGVQLNIGGDVRTVMLGTTPLQAGVIPGHASIELTVNLVDIILANFAYALGIPQADIANARLPLDVDLGTADIDALYLKGVLQNGDIIEIDAWGMAQTLQQLRAKLANQGVATIPLTGKPAILQILQYQ